MKKELINYCLILAFLAVFISGIIFGGYIILIKEKKSEKTVEYDLVIKEEDLTGSIRYYSLMSEETDHIKLGNYPYDVEKESYIYSGITRSIHDLKAPMIELNSEDASKANKEIQALYDKAVKAYNNFASSSSYESKIEFETSTYKKYEAVLIKQMIVADTTPAPSYLTYVFDTTTNKNLSLKEYCEKENIDYDELMEKCEEAIKMTLNKYFVDFYLEQSIENFKENQNYLIDNEGNIQIISNLMTPLSQDENPMMMKIHVIKK